jgi:hypothetical protein
MFNRNAFMYLLLYYSRELMKKYMFWLLAQGKSMKVCKAWAKKDQHPICSKVDDVTHYFKIR